MSIKAYDVPPYNDDFNTSSLEGKNYLRILFKPGFSVQVRELNQLQSMLQSQIDKFGKSVYEEGPILDGSTFFTDNTDFVDVTINATPVSNGLMSNLNLTHGTNIRVYGSDARTISAEIYAHQVLSTTTNSVRFYIRYSSSGAEAGGTETNTSLFTNPSTLQSNEGIFLGENQYINSGETLGVITNLGYAGRITTDVGVFFARGSFIYNDTVKYTFIEKPTKEFQITGKAVFRLDESAVNSTTDSTLFDNAAGSPNFAAPGADRYAITLTPLFLTDQSELTDITNNSAVLASTASGNELVNYLDLLDVSISQYVAPARTEYSQLDSKLAVRTSEESGNYTVNPFKVSVREHLNDAAGNGGRFLSADGGLESKYIATIEPSVAYVQGYRLPLEETLELPVDKARTQLDVAEVSFGAAKIGNFIEGTIVEVPDFTDPSETYTFDGDGTVTCKIRSIERTSSETAAGDDIFRIYIYDLSADIPRNATTLSGNNAEGASGFILTLTGTTTSEPTPIFETSNNKNFITLPYNTISAIEKGGSSPNFESEVAIRGTKTGITAGASSLTLTVSDLTGKSAGRFYNDSLSAYIVIDQSDGSVIDVTGVTLQGTNNNEVELSGTFGSATVTVVASAKIAIGPNGLTSKTKTETTISAELVTSTTSTAVATNDIFSLDERDIISITSVTDGSGGAIQPTDYELFDNGQRDGQYKVGRIKYTGSGVTGLKVTYKYFLHSSGDLFDVSSYATYPYKDIPQYKGTYLSDVLDFRPNDNASSSFTLDPNGPTKVTLNYYLSRIDKVVVNTVNDYSVIKGEPSSRPDPPVIPSDSMALYDIYVPAFTREIKDIQLRYIDNRRFTMRDIGRLEKRIENLEYYTSLSLLEREANGKQILDADGDRFKNGILVDSFQTQGIADVLDPKLKVAFNTQKGILRPQYTIDNKRLYFNGYDGSDVALTRADSGGTLLTLPFTDTALITQDTASIDISVNPYDLATWNGTIELSPASDEWIEVNRRPDVVMNINGGLDALANSLNESDALATYDEAWSTHSVGKKIDSSSRRLSNSEKAEQGFTGWRPVRETTSTFETTEIREGLKQEAVVNTVQQNIGDRVVDINFIPFIRSRRVYFKAQLLKPNTRVHAFFDGIDVSDFCTKTTFIKHKDNSTVDTSTFDLEASAVFTAIGTGRVELVTDTNGDLEGFFVIPNNQTFKFRTGTRKFKLTDSSTNDLANTTTSAETTYSASGLLQNKESQILSTQQIQLQTTDERVAQYRPGVTTQTQTAYYDPLAQSFIIGNIPTGTYTTKIDLYFKERSANVPLSIHLVTVENGIPTQKMVPFSKVIKKPNEVNISETAATATTFNFESPVYLSPGVEYAIIVMSNSPDYRLWMSEVGGDDVTTGTRISKNTYAGVSFKSQNASTWTPDQNKDFKMTIYRAQFSGLSGTTYRLDPLFSAGEGSFNFSTLRLLSEELNFAETSLTHTLRIGSEDILLNSGEDKYFEEVKSIDAADTDGNIASGEGALNIEFASSSDFVSPVVDLDRLSLLAIQNTIGPEQANPNDTPPRADAVINTSGIDTELASTHGDATARYITREVELNNAADQINILLLANKPTSNSEIRVYVRVKSTDERIRDVGFTKVEPELPLTINSGEVFDEAEYKFENTEPFTSFQVKIVFTSEDPAYAPRIKDFRAIATI
jgi:hypothetical protein